MRLLALLLAACAPLGATPAGEPLLLPRPLKLEMRQGSVAAARLAEPGFIRAEVDAALGAEAYHLEVAPDGVRIAHGDPRGLRLAMETLRQLGRGADGAGLAALPLCRIEDRPRFAWRGFMLDESRHFTGKEGVKRLLEAMARLKLNTLHWHLTDEPGWRIEIRKHPRLTEVGGIGNHTDPRAPRTFYTQEEIREIVAFAAARGITVVPEIDMPGHARAAVRAYPEHGGGGSKRYPDFTFNPAKPETEQFLTDILAEVRALFPKAPFVHLGGDEVHFGWEQWPKLPEVKALMAREGLKELREVEGRFVRRMTRRAIDEAGWPAVAFWDEAARFDLPREQTVLFWWRHDKPDALAASAAKGYPLVLCPRIPCYLDFVQDAAHTSGRRWGKGPGSFNTLEQTHAFPDSLGAALPGDARILGIQACLWTETAVTQERRDFLTFPRLMALAEAAWTAPGRKDFPRFRQAVEAELPGLEALGIRPWKGGPEVAR